MPTATAPWGSCRSAIDCVDSNLSALLVHTGEQVPLLQDLDTCATGCRLDVGRLLEAGTRIANAIDTGADIVIINRFGKQEREGKGLAYLIERALDADIPVVIAVSSHRFADWIKFASGMSVKLACNRASLDAWWRAVSGATPAWSRAITSRSAKPSNDIGRLTPKASPACGRIPCRRT